MQLKCHLIFEFGSEFVIWILKFDIPLAILLSSPMSQTYDTIIIGTGIAGLSAGMYAGRFNMKTLVIGAQPGGIITTTDAVENYPGIKHISGADMGMTFYEHAKMFGAEIKNEVVADVAADGKIFKIKTAKNAYGGKTLIFATGTEHRKLNVSGEKEFAGRGVSYCALCDAAFYKDKTVAVVGGGDAAGIEALVLADQCRKVYMIVRREIMRAEPITIKKIMNNPKIKVLFRTEIAEILGNGKVTGIRLKSDEEIELDGVFIAIGYVPNSDLAKKIGVSVDSSGFIKTNVNAETNVKGVYAAGDVTDKPFKQAIIGAAEGVMAVYNAHQYLQNMV